VLLQTPTFRAATLDAEKIHAAQSVVIADPQGNPCGGADRFASFDAAGRTGAPVGGWDLYLAPGGLSGVAQDRSDRA